MKLHLDYFEYNERQHTPKDKYHPLPRDVIPFIVEESIHVKESHVHPREFAKLFPAFARPHLIKRK
jgi:hypothetical protein